MKIEVIDVVEISNNIIFWVKVEGDKYVIGDVFFNTEKNIEFELMGIGLENLPSSNFKSFLVKSLSKNEPIEMYKGLYFSKIES